MQRPRNSRANDLPVLSQNRHQRTGRTRLDGLPEDCRLLIVKHMSSVTRAAWRTVNKQSQQDVLAATCTLTWRRLRRHLCSDSALLSSDGEEEADSDLPTAGGALRPDYEAPCSDGEAPCDEDEAPYSEDEAPYDEDEAPYAEDEAPYDEDEAPYTEDEAPYDEDEAPYAEDEAPHAEDEAPHSDDEDLDSDDESLDTFFYDFPCDEEHSCSDDDEDPDDVPLPLRLPLPTTLPTLLFAKHPHLFHLSCRDMRSLTSIHGIPATLRSLDLCGCNSLDSVEPLRQCTALEQLALTLRRSQGLVETLVPFIKQHKQLRCLKVLSMHCTDTAAVAEGIASTPAQLTSLSLEGRCGGRVSSRKAAAAALSSALKAHSATLKSVALACTPCHSDSMATLAPGLRCCSALTSLDYRDNVGGSDGANLASALSGSASSLTTLRLVSLSMDDEGAAALAPVLRTMTSLVMLHFRDSWCEKRGASALGHALSSIAPSLTYLNLSSCNCAPLSMLRCMVALERLYCDHLGLGPRQTTALASALPALTRLKHLSINDNPIGFRGLKALAGHLKALPGGQRWVITFADALINDDGVLRNPADAEELAGIMRGVTGVCSWEVRDTILCLTDERVASRAKVMGLSVTL